MEENKKKIAEEAAQKELSYDELKRVASDLHVQYQKLQAEYLKARQALDEQDFNYTAFFLQMLFKVLEHPENYSKEFVPWCAKNIELALTTFADNRAKQAESAVQGGKNEA